MRAVSFLSLASVTCADLRHSLNPPADVKARLLGSRFAEAPQKPDRATRLAYARRGPGAQSTPAVSRATMEADSVDDFLDSL